MNRLTVAETASLLGVSEQQIRIGLQRGIFKFGVAIPNETRSKFVYHISKNKVYNYLGLLEEKEASLSIDIEAYIDKKINEKIEELLLNGFIKNNNPLSTL